MNSFFFIKKLFRLNLKLNLKLPKIYVCDPITFFRLRTNSNYPYNYLFKLSNNDSYTKTTGSDYRNFNKNQENFRTKTALLAVPLSFFIYEMYKNTIKCEENPIFKEATIENPIEKPYLGCSIRSKKGKGMQIVLIKSDSPAEKAGLQVGDVIISINGVKTTSINEYFASIGSEKGGKKVVFYRDSEKEAVEVWVKFE